MSNIPDIVMQAMKLVESQQLSGEQKKAIVINVIRKIAGNNPIILELLNYGFIGNLIEVSVSFWKMAKKSSYFKSIDCFRCTKSKD